MFAQDQILKKKTPSVFYGCVNMVNMRFPHLYEAAKIHQLQLLLFAHVILQCKTC